MRRYRLITWLFLSVLAGGCTIRPGAEAVLAVAPVEQATTVPVYVASTRARSPAHPHILTGARAAELQYGRYVVSVPPGHHGPEIPIPRYIPDPHKHFAVIDSEALSAPEFYQSLTQAKTEAPKTEAPKTVGIYIHGYNTRFPEALFRLAQMTNDSGDIASEPALLFTWPSLGRVRGYLSDRDSVLYSRDHLSAVLIELARREEVGEIMILGHSLGGWLVLESLRQLRLQGEDAVLDKLNVSLAAPDIDLDLFAQQMAVIGPLRQPMTVLVATDDRALRVSQRLAAAPRLGALDVADPWVHPQAVLANIRIIDISQLRGPDRLRHERYVNWVHAARHMMQPAPTGPAEGVRQAGAFMFNAVAATLSTPFALAGQALAGE